MAKSVTINSSTKKVTVTQGGTDATSIQGKSVSDSAPSDDQILAWIASASEIQWTGVDDLGSGFVNENGDTMSGLLQLDAGVRVADDQKMAVGDSDDHWFEYASGAGELRVRSADVDGGGTAGTIFSVSDGQQNLSVKADIDFPNITGTPSFGDHDHSEGGMSTVPNSGLTNSSVTVTAGDGLKSGGSVALGSSVTLDIKPADFAGTFLSDDGSDNLQVDIGTGLQNDGSGNIQVDAGSIDTGILGVSQGGTGVDGSTATAGQLLIGHATNSNFSLATLTGGNAISITNADGSVTLDVPTDSIQVDEIDQSIAPTWTGNHQWDDDTQVQLGAAPDYWFVYNSTATELRLRSADTDGVGTTGTIFSVADGGSVLDFSTTPTVSGTNVVLESRSLTGGDGIASIGDLSQDRTIAVDLTTSGGLKIETGTISVEPADFAGTFLSDDGSDNLQVDIGTGLQNDGSGNIQVDVGAVDTGILGVSQGGTGLDSSGVTAGQLLIGHGTNGNFNLSTLTGGTNVSITNADGSITIDFDPADVEFGDDETLDFGATPDYWHVYDSTGTQYRFRTADNDGGGTTGDIFTVQDGSDVVAFTSTPTAGGTAVVLESRTLTGGDGIQALGDLSSDRTVAVAPGDFTGSGLTTSGSPTNIDVGAGTAITVNANDVQVTAGGITTTELDLSISPAWTGTHDFSGGGFIFPTASAPTPTTEGQAIWDTDDDKLRVGDGTAAVTLVDEGRTLTGGGGIASIGDLTQDRTIAVDLTSSGGLKIETGTISVEPADFAGTGLQDDGSDNLQVDASSVDTGTLGVSVGGTGVDASTVTAGQLLIGNATNSDFDLATLTGGDGVAVTNADGSVTLAVDLVSSGGLSFTAGELGVDESSVDHDSLQNFVANEHIDWTADQGATNIAPENFPHDHTEGALSTIPNSGLTNSAVTVAGQSVSLGGSTTVAVEHLSNAALPSATAAGQLLIWDATDGQFENATLTGGNSLSVTNADASITLDVDTSPSGQTAVGTTRTITTGTGLSGGGDLSADRTLSVDNYSNLARLDQNETVSGAWTFNATPDFTTGINVNGSSFADGSGNLVVSSTGPHVLGGSSASQLYLWLRGSLSGNAPEALRPDVDLTGTSGTTQMSQVRVRGSITTQGASETITTVAGIRVEDPDVTVGTGDTLTNAVNVYIPGAPTEGTNNYALWVDGGLTRLDGDLEAHSDIIPDTDATGSLGRSGTRWGDAYLSALDVSGASTFSGDVTLGMASQDYTFYGPSGARLGLKSQTSGTDFTLALATADQDATDDVTYRIYGEGEPGAVTQVWMEVGWSASSSRYQVRTNSTGTQQPLHVFSATNTNQFVARTDGNVAMANSLKVGGTGAASETLDVSGASTFSGDVTLGMASGQDYKIVQGRANTILGIQSQTAGDACIVDLYTKDGDGTDPLRFSLYALGKPGSAGDREQCRIAWDASTKFEVRTFATGAGTLRPLHVFTGSNTNQIVARTDGNVAMSGSLKVGGTGAAVGGFQVVSDNINFGSNSSDAEVTLRGNRPISGQGVGSLECEWDGTLIGDITFLSGDDDTNKDEGDILFRTAAAGSMSEVGRFTQEGQFHASFPNSATGTPLVVSGSGLNEIKRADGINVPGASTFSGNVQLNDDVQLQFGDAPDYWTEYESANTRWRLRSADIDGSSTAGDIARVPDGRQVMEFVDDVLFAGLGFRARVESIAMFAVEDLEEELNQVTTGFGDSRRLGVNTDAYSISNDSTDRTFDANSTTTAELADVLATLIRDLGRDS